MDKSLVYTLEIINKATAPLVAVHNQVSNVTSKMNHLSESSQVATKTVSSLSDSFFRFNQIGEVMRNVSEIMQNAAAPGIALNQKMAELQAITGLTGKGIDDINNKARESAKEWGLTADNVAESYKIILSQLGPGIASSTPALDAMGQSVAILSKQMNGDGVAAAGVLTSAMNQYGVSMDDPIKASKIMTEYMNVMAAGAREGSAELPLIKLAIENVGKVAKESGLSFEQMNSAIQMLDKSGKRGAEGGVALRNVLLEMNTLAALPKEVREGLVKYGVDINKVMNASIPFTERLKELQKIKGNDVLMTKIFGKENMVASLSLMESADAQSKLTEQIAGTNAATDMAKTIMDSYAERMKRSQAIVWRRRG